MKDERKVRATESTPLPKIEAVGDNRVRQKRMTARYYHASVRGADKLGKGEKVV